MLITIIKNIESQSFKVGKDSEVISLMLKPGKACVQQQRSITAKNKNE